MAFTGQTQPPAGYWQDDPRLLFHTEATFSFNIGTTGTLYSRYMREGNLVRVYGQMTLGTAWAAPDTTRWVLQLPFNSLNTNTVLGSCWVNPDNNGTHHTAGLCPNLGNNTQIGFYVPNSATASNIIGVGTASGNLPGGIAWAVGGYIRWNLQYECLPVS